MSSEAPCDLPVLKFPLIWELRQQAHRWNEPPRIAQLSMAGQEATPGSQVLSARYRLPCPLSCSQAMEGAGRCLECRVWCLHPLKAPGGLPSRSSTPRLGDVEMKKGRETQGQLGCGRTTPRPGTGSLRRPVPDRMPPCWESMAMEPA